MFTQILKSRLLLILIFSVVALSLAASAATKSDDEHVLSLKQPLITQQVCRLAIELESPPQTKNQTLDLGDNIKMKLANFVAIKVRDNANIASNITCQQLMGASYTGSNEEWTKFFDSAFKGMLAAELTNIKFTLVGEQDSVFGTAFTKDFMVKEYIFTGDAGGNKQIINNLALLDKTHNTVYTFSVSGNIEVEADIQGEFSRLVKSIKRTAN